MEAQIFADPVLPPTHGHFVLRSLVLLICTSIAAAEFAASRKTAKYVSLAASYIFFQGPLSEEARQLQCDLGRRISASSGDVREMSFLFQCVSVVMQRFNAVLLHDSFCVVHRPE